jgi:hypothetical protein
MKTTEQEDHMTIVQILSSIVLQRIIHILRYRVEKTQKVEKKYDSSGIDLSDPKLSYFRISCQLVYTSVTVVST